MSNIFQKRIIVYNILSELINKLESIEKDADWNIDYYTQQLSEISEDDSWRTDNYRNTISENEERKDAVAQVRKYIESYSK